MPACIDPDHGAWPEFISTDLGDPKWLARQSPNRTTRTDYTAYERRRDTAI